MSTSIRPMAQNDAQPLFEMMRAFYDSPAVLSEVSDEVLKQNIADCIGDIPFIEGLAIEYDGELVGYSMLSKTYSTERGGICMWIEDLYILPEYQGKGIGKTYLNYLDDRFKNESIRLRLEVAKSNTKAIELYKRYGFSEIDYIEMCKYYN